MRTLLTLAGTVHAHDVVLLNVTTVWPPALLVVGEQAEAKAMCGTTETDVATATNAATIRPEKRRKRRRKPIEEYYIIAD
jgi:hypothetical protein